MPARWFPILSAECDGLHTLMGLDYNGIYLPAMIQCGLVVKISNQCGSNIPTVSIIRAKKGAYTWNDFLTEHGLDLEVEVHRNFGIRKYYLRVGRFQNGNFTIAQQLKQDNKPSLHFAGVRKNQMGLIASLASILE